MLYGLDLARETIRKTRTAVLVEGYLDVIGLHQVGVTGAVAVCGTALTPEHVELLDPLRLPRGGDPLRRRPGRPGRARQGGRGALPAGPVGQGGTLPSEGGKTDPDDYARAHGRAGVEALLAVGRAAVGASSSTAPRPQSCGATPREAPLEGKLAAVRELEPFLRMMPEGLARSVFEDAVARRLDLDPGALKAELAVDRRSARSAPPPESARGGSVRPAPRPEPLRAPGRVRLVLPGPAADALGILVAFPELGPVAEEEGLPQLLPAGSLADLARDLCRAPVPIEEALARVAAGADAMTLRRVRDFTGPGRPLAEVAERELRKAVVKAGIEGVRQEQDRLLALIAKKGAPVPEDLEHRGAGRRAAPGRSGEAHAVAGAERMRATGTRRSSTLTGPARPGAVREMNTGRPSRRRSRAR